MLMALPESQLVYDALTMPVVDEGQSLVAFIGLFFLCAITITAWALSIGPFERSRKWNNGQEKVGFAFAFLIIVGFYIYNAAITQAWRSSYRHGKFEIIEGCLIDFNEVVHRDHDLGVDTFTVRGRTFTISDSGWRAGYHLSRHHGSPLRQDAHVRLFADGDRLLRIEVGNRPCAEGAVKSS